MTRALWLLIVGVFLILVGTAGWLEQGSMDGSRLVDVAGVSYRVDRLSTRVDQVEHAHTSPEHAPSAADLQVRVGQLERAVATLRVALDTLVTISPAPRHREHAPAIDGVRVGLSYVPAENESVDGTAVKP